MGLDQFLFNEHDTEVMYWRKANQIHSWFERKVGGVENCKAVDVTMEQLLKLKEDCKKVIEDPNSASEILPTTPGFFFGSLDYDDWYFQDIENTIKAIEKIQGEYGSDDKFFYYAWW